MKLLFILSAVFLTTAQANFFTDLGQGFTNLFKALGQSILHQLDTTGVQLLNASVAAGKTLISQGIQALALNTANALAKSSRDIQLPAMLKNVESPLHNVVDTLMGEMKNVFGFLVKGLQGVVDKMTKLEITHEEVIKEVDKFVNTHNLIADSFLKTTKDKVEEVIFSLIKSKRNNFTDFFAGTGESLTKTFKPMVDGVKTLATAAGAIHQERIYHPPPEGQGLRHPAGADVPAHRSVPSRMQLCHMLFPVTPNSKPSPT
ncbi:uncharacterized protein LOC124281010 [Haliotis rubra]|uniref:uncharacterized protein LOC124281010 n=1 Tax=Haliotis rubra TaxID=36100 RepID=UPI001EE5111D|nr:uncharacterized protein LOC124281010 [Haliotis rubra]